MEDSARTHRTERLRHRLQTGPPLVLDGAGGTALEDEGIDTTGPLWSAHALDSHPDRVARLHARYAQAGAQVHTTITFRTHPGRFTVDDGQQAWQKALQSGVDATKTGLQQAGVERDAHWIAGPLAPVGDSYAPEQVPPDDVLRHEHGAQAKGLHDAGVDLLIVETMLQRREATIAARAALETGLPVWVSFVVDDQARLLSKEPLAPAIEKIQDLGVDAVLVNCASLENTTKAVQVLAETSRVPWGAYANASPGGPETGWGPRQDPNMFAQAAQTWLAMGAKIIGSCCGTGPAHTRALAQTLAQASPH